MTKEGKPQRFDAIIISDHQTYFHGELLQYRRDWELKINLREGADVKKGDLVPVVDVFVAMYPKETGEV